MHTSDSEDAQQFVHEGVALVCDDEAIVCQVAKEMLEELGFTVLTASDGNQALEVFREHMDEISFVLLDFTMPGLDAAQVFQEMKRLNTEIKVILSSGYSERDVTHQFMSQGLAGFIQKPYTMVKLTKKLNEVMRKI
jgi:CheY-like chemotaxis protein